MYQKSREGKGSNNVNLERQLFMDAHLPLVTYNQMVVGRMVAQQPKKSKNLLFAHGNGNCTAIQDTCIVCYISEGKFNLYENCYKTRLIWIGTSRSKNRLSQVRLASYELIWIKIWDQTKLYVVTNGSHFSLRFGPQGLKLGRVCPQSKKSVNSDPFGLIMAGFIWPLHFKSNLVLTHFSSLNVLQIQMSTDAMVIALTK